MYKNEPPKDYVPRHERVPDDVGPMSLLAYCTVILFSVGIGVLIGYLVWWTP